MMSMWLFLLAGVVAAFPITVAQQGGQRFCCYGSADGPFTCGCIDAINITSPSGCPGGGPGPVIWDDFWVATDDLCCRYQNLVLAYPFYDFSQRQAVWRWLFAGSIGPPPGGEDLAIVTTTIGMTNNYTKCYIDNKCPPLTGNPTCSDSCTSKGGNCGQCQTPPCPCKYPSLPNPISISGDEFQEYSIHFNAHAPSKMNHSRIVNRPPLLDTCGQEGSACHYDSMGPCHQPPCCCAGLVCMLDHVIGCDPSLSGCTCTAC